MRICDLYHIPISYTLYYISHFMVFKIILLSIPTSIIEK